MSSSNIHSTVNFTSSSSTSSSSPSSVVAPSVPLPSVFELLAEERLSSLIRPCLRQVFKFLHENRPMSNILRILYRYKDEFILLIEGIIQWLYLHSYSALVGERFYGFKRTADNRLRSLIFSVFLPYVQAKLESLQEQIQANNNTNNRSRSFYILVYILPKVQVFIEGLCWLYRLGYAFGKTEYYSPALQLAGVKLVYAKTPTPAAVPTTFFSRFFSNISQVMSTGLFLIQFVDWWNNTAGAKKKSPENTSTIPPVPRTIERQTSINRRQCPLCRQPCNIPTAVIGSGYVYCNKCIVDYVQRYHRCPTTNQSVTVEQLIKVY